MLSLGQNLEPLMKCGRKSHSPDLPFRDMMMNDSGMKPESPNQAENTALFPKCQVVFRSSNFSKTTAACRAKSLQRR
jgi:hypothetical protein